MSAQAEVRTCLKCRRVCDAEAYIALKDGSVFHKHCFTCELCQLELPLKFACKNGKYFHIECYASAKAKSPKCVRCEQAIIGTEVSVIIGNDCRFHGRCFACDICQRPLTERFQNVSGMFLHEECVPCVSCSVPVLGRNYSQLQDGTYMCDQCIYANMRNQEQIASNNGGVPQQQQQQVPQQQVQQQQQIFNANAHTPQQSGYSSEVYQDAWDPKQNAGAPQWANQQYTQQNGYGWNGQPQQQPNNNFRGHSGPATANAAQVQQQYGYGQQQVNAGYQQQAPPHAAPGQQMYAQQQQFQQQQYQGQPQQARPPANVAPRAVPGMQQRK